MLYKTDAQHVFNEVSPDETSTLDFDLVKVRHRTGRNGSMKEDFTPEVDFYSSEEDIEYEDPDYSDVEELMARKKPVS